MCFTGSVKQISFIVSARVSVAGYLHSIMCFTGSVKQISFIVSARVSVAGYLHSVMCFTGSVKSVLSFQLVSVLLATYGSVKSVLSFQLVSVLLATYGSVKSVLSFQLVSVLLATYGSVKSVLSFQLVSVLLATYIVWSTSHAIQHREPVPAVNHTVSWIILGGLLTRSLRGARCSSVVRAFAHGVMGRRIDPSWGEPTELFLVPTSAPRLM